MALPFYREIRENPEFKEDDTGITVDVRVGDKTYIAEYLQGRSASGGGLWAPDIQYFNGTYHLYYAVSNSTLGGSAIFVATSDSPIGPWNASSAPVVAPAAAPCCSGLRGTIDPAVVQGDAHGLAHFEAHSARNQD